jgi:hypothetical protein
MQDDTGNRHWLRTFFLLGRSEGQLRIMGNTKVLIFWTLILGPWWGWTVGLFVLLESSRLFIMFLRSGPRGTRRLLSLHYRALCNTRHKNNNNSHKSLYIQLDIVSYIVEMIFCNDRTRKIYLKIISLLLSVDRKTTAP